MSRRKQSSPQPQATSGEPIPMRVQLVFMAGDAQSQPLGTLVAEVGVPLPTKPGEIPTITIQLDAREVVARLAAVLAQQSQAAQQAAQAVLAHPDGPPPPRPGPGLYLPPSASSDWKRSQVKAN